MDLEESYDPREGYLQMLSMNQYSGPYERNQTFYNLHRNKAP